MDARKTGLSVARLVMIWVLTFAFVVVPPNLFGWGQNWVSLLRLATSGQTAIGRITQSHTADHDGCVYTFAAKSQVWIGSREACRGEVGGPITVHYLASDPAVHSAYSPAQALFKDCEIALLIPTALTSIVALNARRRRRAAT